MAEACDNTADRGVGDPGDGCGASAIILAAGKGTRMQSDLPKVCHEIGGRPMVCAVVDACKAAGCGVGGGRIVVVVGFRQELVREALAGMDVEFAVQEEQLGTGHAVGVCEPMFAGGGGGGGECRDVLVLCGDGPLVRPGTLRTLLDRHRSSVAAATLATSVIDDPTGYGRIVRDASGRFERIVEQAEAGESERAICEVNPSYYCFDREGLFEGLRGVPRQEGNGEYYITDIFSLMREDGLGIEVIEAVPSEDVFSINTPEQLAQVDGLYRQRHAEAQTERGVR